jgi:C-terminal processing protease CtpA/Prc
VNGPDAVAAAVALELLREHAYYAERVDWTAVRAEVSELVADGESVDRALAPALAALGDRHSHLKRDTPIGRAFWSRSRPRGELPRDGVGYLTVPRFTPATSDDGISYVRAGWEIMARYADVRGWVVDLRGNSGGNVHRMLAAVGPLLGGSRFLSYRRRTGAAWHHRFVAGQLLVEATPPNADAGPGTGVTWPGAGMSVGVEAPVVGERVPVAVLHDGHTTSAGEGVVVAFRGRPRTRSFGTATEGVPTGNVTYPLPGGWLLAVTTSVAVDRNAAVYQGPIEPDQPGGLDPVARAARWLSCWA